MVSRDSGNRTYPFRNAEDRIKKYDSDAQHDNKWYCNNFKQNCYVNPAHSFGIYQTLTVSPNLVVINR